ncbi:MAG TPA: hypothetical protein VN672_09285 [Solirubrobacteraceae bacterium]|jgi:hypothetical protein|nr:hypothetical protein [Solirubrobacteraceae bacterium]
MRFRITRHAGHAAPADAMELLLRRLGPRRDEVSFALVGAELRATTDDGEGYSWSREERVDVARRAIFDMLVEVCADAPELEAEWFAVGRFG